MVRFRAIHHPQQHTTPDFGVLKVLQLACLPDDEPVFPENGSWWVGYDMTSRQPIAFGLVKPSSQWRDTAYLARAGVLPAYRGQGLQRRLITLRERFARRQGYRWMISDTTDNTPSANNLIKAGYRLLDPSSPWASSDTLYWVKDLTKAR
jgi:GNAT superfamily N-acetyltransferase